MSQQGGERELVLGNKQLISLFFVVVALCGVFFAMGYMVRGNSLKGSLTAPSDAATPAASDPVKRQQPDPLATASESPRTSAQNPAPTEVSSTPSQPAETRPALDTSLAASQSKSDDHSSFTAEAGAFYVQVGALARSDAEATARTLREQHLPAILAASSKEGLFRVLVGPYHLTTDVAEAKGKLKTLGFSNTIVQKQ